MSLTQEQKHQFEKLVDCRDSIVDALGNIQYILKEYFPEEFEVAYQFWIPQITTALHEDKKWLSRGDRTMQQTIDRLMLKINDGQSKGVSKYIH